jgi:hypothetical protein
MCSWKDAEARYHSVLTSYIIYLCSQTIFEAIKNVIKFYVKERMDRWKHFVYPGITGDNNDPLSQYWSRLGGNRIYIHVIIQWNTTNI